MKPENEWPRDVTMWLKDRVLHLSVPFTWLLPTAGGIARQTSWAWDHVVVGGPAVMLKPDYFESMDWVMVGGDCKGVLQRVNYQATKTTVGCPNRCQFCAVPQIEGAFQELDDWPDLPVLIDNNLLAASQKHLDRVFDRLERWEWADFNQGLEAARITDYHAERLKRIGQPMIRLALDHIREQPKWNQAFETLRKRRIAKSRIRTYALIGFNSGPGEAWNRCQWIEGHGVKALPMWYHELDAMEANIITDRQRELGWTDYERRKIMQWFYQHKKAVR